MIPRDWVRPAALRPVGVAPRRGPSGTGPDRRPTLGPVDETASHPIATRRAILTAELLAVGTELTVGETTDTNSGELARSLVAHGVTVARISDLPDHQPTVVDAIRTALGRADLVVMTGGLGPTPDDLTREAVAEACGEELETDPRTMAWLEALWARRSQPFPESNRKQAWLIRSATTLANVHGTAPGWWVDRPDGRVIVLLPGPPREMRPMWQDHVLPRLVERGVGGDSDVRTLRLTGIGESQVVERLGEPLLRRTNPIVATYARHEAVDVRISARAEGGRTAADLAADAEATVLGILGEHVWARGDATWADALGEVLAARGWTLATSEQGTEGALVALLRGMPALRRAEVVGGGAATPTPEDEPELREADRVRSGAGADVGLAIRVEPAGQDTSVHVGIVTPSGRHAERRLAFLGGRQGADRAAIAGAAALQAYLRSIAWG
jgi:nicotinamide-nucleotide amidase